VRADETLRSGDGLFSATSDGRTIASSQFMDPGA